MRQMLCRIKKFQVTLSYVGPMHWQLQSGCKPLAYNHISTNFVYKIQNHSHLKVSYYVYKSNINNVLISHCAYEDILWTTVLCVACINFCSSHWWIHQCQCQEWFHFQIHLSWPHSIMTCQPSQQLIHQNQEILNIRIRSFRKDNIFSCSLLSIILICISCYILWEGGFCSAFPCQGNFFLSLCLKSFAQNRVSNNSIIIIMAWSLQVCEVTSDNDWNTISSSGYFSD